MNPVLNWFKPRWRLLIVLLTPLVFLPIPLVGRSSQARCGYIVIILTIYWVFEAIPLPVTSLLPLALFPMAGVLTAEHVAPHYFKDIITLFFGSMSLAYAVESVNLHRRIALLSFSINFNMLRSMAGLMGVTAFLSMWINNSAAASIMLPVALAITDELESHSKGSQEKKNRIKEATVAVNEMVDISKPEFNNEHSTEVSLDQLHIEEPKPPIPTILKKRFQLPWKNRNLLVSVESHEQKYAKIRKGFLLSVAYSATIGGLSSLVGTAPNIFVKGFADSQYKNTAFRINFLNFLLFALPVALLMLVLCWLWLQIYYNFKELFQFRVDEATKAAQADLKAMLIQQYRDLGKPKWSELSVAIVFVCMIILWVTKDFSGTPGWEVIFQDDYISDGTVAILCGILPLILPNANPLNKDWKYEPIIGWKNLAQHMPWGALILLGAGLSVASAFQASKLSESVARALRFLAGIPQAAVILLIIIISGLFTEVTSNLSTASIFFPVLDSVARTSGMHPAFLILPCTLAVSLAFMLPIATPPNAIVFASGTIRVIDMVKTGIVMNIIGFLVIFFAATTWMPKIYGLNDKATEIFFSINTTLNNPGLYNGTV
ncbi:unnamed protein product [Rotaria sp. Silwood2]|nr:unnamed protein product [Rotaria sp. Silwood2]CAF2752659.1 unnamed protein product [Rotaria sp. Silwood2]CAF2998805.1 unnamed protein product [Rotaria sp. Silwood2]CAF4059282.1 unnamed protein product [Rotaria sp. Silwood2]CAF4242760.1 unnamed protein product [Rotaria sp. Silwood2]